MLSALVVAFLWAVPATGASLKKDIAEQKQKVKQQKAVISRLTKQERALYKDMAHTEDRIGKLEADLAAQQQRLATAEKGLEAAKDRIRVLEKGSVSLGKDLKRILRGLWDFHVQKNMANQGRDIADWDKADREYVWTLDLYSAAGETLTQLKANRAEASAALERSKKLATQVRKELAEVNSTKDKLLKDQLAFSQKISKVRKEKLTHEQEMKRVMSVIQGLQYKLSREEAVKGKDFPKQKGLLLRPVDGKIVARFSPNASPPQRGLGFAAPQSAPVHAVAWGKVVHNDILRGFGRVIILLHSDDYYTLYAFLDEGKVQMGSEVNRGDVIGTTGYYPKTKSGGLYFELRFRQKAINPEKWLAAAQ